MVDRSKQLSEESGSGLEVLLIYKNVEICILTL